MKRITARDVTVEPNRSGMLTLSAVVEGALRRRRYLGYSRKVCVRDFVRLANSDEPGWEEEFT